MILGEATERLDVEVAEVSQNMPGGLGGDVRLQIRAQIQEFSGAVDAWIDREAWKDFLGQLTQLERDRQGSAALLSMSPGELRLTFRMLDMAGHAGVEGELMCYRYPPRGAPSPLRLEFGIIEFDPTLLPSLVDELQRASSSRLPSR